MSPSRVLADARSCGEWDAALVRQVVQDARMAMGVSCAVSGTGFLFSREIIEKDGGWKNFLLTEDIEFSIQHILQGYRIAYCQDAVLYDEQPVKFSQSWRQRLRWAKGFYQVLLRYGTGLLKGVAVRKGGRWACFDMFMTIAPAMLLTLTSVFVNLAFCLMGLVQLVGMAPAMTE